MSTIRCSLQRRAFSEANFCRQCGAAVTSGGAVITSEEPTRNANGSGVATERWTQGDQSWPSFAENSMGNSVAAASLGGQAPPSRRNPVALLVGASSCHHHCNHLVGGICQNEKPQPNDGQRGADLSGSADGSGHDQRRWSGNSAPDRRFARPGRVVVRRKP